MQLISIALSKHLCRLQCTKTCRSQHGYTQQVRLYLTVWRTCATLAYIWCCRAAQPSRAFLPASDAPRRSLFHSRHSAISAEHLSNAGWKQIRKHYSAGFLLCSDGRSNHVSSPACCGVAGSPAHLALIQMPMPLNEAA